MLRFLITLLTALTINGCGKSSCESLINSMCDKCVVSDTDEDLSCACLKDGDVKNALDYFESVAASEAWCANLKISLEEDYLSPAELADCDGNLDTFEKFGSDACSIFGLKGSESSQRDSGSSGYESADADKTLAETK